MDDSLSSGVVVGLDLNQEPLEQLPSYQGLIDELESTQSRIHERIRQLGEVIERRNSRQQARRSDGNSHVPLRIIGNMSNEGGESSRVDDVDMMERNNGSEKKYKRNSDQLVARALAMDPEIKKVDKKGGNFYDCNVCLEMAEDPILTCCGHLFCWVCFYKLPHQDSASKECPVCLGEVSDNTIVPIYGNGNDCNTLKTESIFKVPPRPKAQRVESGRQLRLSHGPPVPVSEALRRIRTSIGAIGGHFNEIARPENFNYNAVSQNSQIPRTTDGLHHLSHHQGLRVSSESSSLSDISTALTDAEVIVDEMETYIGSRLWQTRTLVSEPLTVNDAVVQTENQSLNLTDIAPPWRTIEDDAAIQLENLANGSSSVASRLQQQSSSSSRRRSRRLLDADRSSSHHSRRRRLN